jgi:hypothetical protein
MTICAVLPRATPEVLHKWQPVSTYLTACAPSCSLGVRTPAMDTYMIVLHKFILHLRFGMYQRHQHNTAPACHIPGPVHSLGHPRPLPLRQGPSHVQAPLEALVSQMRCGWKMQGHCYLVSCL